MHLSEYRGLATVLNDLNVHQISIAGGEPLLRKDVFDIIACFSRYGMSVNLCTNGILLHKYEDEICSSGATCVTVSLDGATAGIHDASRGVVDSSPLIERGIRAMLRRPFARRPLVRVRMTFSDTNAHQINSFYNKWKKVADDVLLQPVHLCSDSYYTGLTDEAYNIDPQVLESQVKGTPFAHDRYMKEFIRGMREQGTFPSQRCYAGVLMVRIDPWGHVYPCLEQHVQVGSVRRHDFREIWNSDAFNQVRRGLITERTCACWYNNTALIGHYGGLLAHTRGDRISERVKNFLMGERRSVSPVNPS
jgi:MoaA/NifB/PqqE/SkfB family radical SAM enzyme